MAAAHAGIPCGSVCYRSMSVKAQESWVGISAPWFSAKYAGVRGFPLSVL